MAYDEYLADRIKQVLNEQRISFNAKQMMGGLCFMVDDKMCCGIVKNQLMARIGVNAYELALSKPHCKEMNFTGRAMKGYVFIDPEGFDSDDDLAYWIQLCIDFNPFAISNKKKK